MAPAGESANPFASPTCDRPAKELKMDQRVGLSPQEPQSTTTRARQAIAPHRLRYMLGAGIAAVVLGFLAVYFLVT